MALLRCRSKTPESMAHSKSPNARKLKKAAERVKLAQEKGGNKFKTPSPTPKPILKEVIIFREESDSKAEAQLWREQGSRHQG